MNKILLFVLSFSFTLPAATYEKYFYGVPKNQKNCHDQAKEISKRFEAITGNKTGRVDCVDDFAKKATFFLSYTADQPLRSVDTDPFVSSMENGIYKKEESCVTALEKKVAAFEKHTGLKALIGYCSQPYQDARWYPYILGYGEPKMEYFVNGYYYFSIPNKFDATSFIENIRTALKGEKAELDEVVSISSLAYGKMAIHYYSTKRLDFQIEEYTKNTNVAECLDQRELFNEALKKAGIPTLTNYCGQVPTGGAWELTSVFFRGLPISARLSVESFKSYEVCSSDRAILTEYYKSNVNKGILEGLCTQVENKFYVLMIQKP